MLLFQSVIMRQESLEMTKFPSEGTPTSTKATGDVCG